MTETQYQEAIQVINQQIDDEVYCALIDQGIDPGVAYEEIFLTPFDLLEELKEVTVSEDDIDDLMDSLF